MKPSLFSTPMVQATMAGRKTQTRRVIKPQSLLTCEAGYIWKTDDLVLCDKRYGNWVAKKDGSPLQPPYAPGDALWVRETWMPCNDIDSWEFVTDIYVYKADCTDAELRELKQHDLAWKPSIHMPKEAARLFLRVKDVWVERVQEISEEDVIAEGIFEVRPGGWFWENPAETSMPNVTLAHSARQAYMWLWNKINEKKAYLCATNPYVWAYEFERISKEENNE